MVGAETTIFNLILYFCDHRLHDKRLNSLLPTPHFTTFNNYLFINGFVPYILIYININKRHKLLRC